MFCIPFRFSLSLFAYEFFMCLLVLLQALPAGEEVKAVKDRHYFNPHFNFSSNSVCFKASSLNQYS